MVSAHPIGAGPAAPAEALKFTGPAFPLQQRDISKVREKRGAVPDLPKCFRRQVSRLQREIAARSDLPPVGDKAHFAAGRAASAVSLRNSSPRRIAGGRPKPSIKKSPLGPHTGKVRGADRPDIKMSAVIFRARAYFKMSAVKIGPLKLNLSRPCFEGRPTRRRSIHLSR